MAPSPFFCLLDDWKEVSWKEVFLKKKWCFREDWKGLFTPQVQLSLQEVLLFLPVSFLEGVGGGSQPRTFRARRRPGKHFEICCHLEAAPPFNNFVTSFPLPSFLLEELPC